MRWPIRAAGLRFELMGHFVYYFQKCDVGFYDDCKYKIAAGLSRAGEIIAIVVLKTFTHL